MTEEQEMSDLEKLKKDYKILQEKYNLPLFQGLNENFQIEKIAEVETDLLLREIRRDITEKLFNYLRFAESLINPNNAPMFVFGIIKTLGAKEKEKLSNLYKKLSQVELELVELDLEYSEQKEAEAIKRYCLLWEEIKKEFKEIIEVIKKNWDVKVEENGKGYFG